MILPQESPTNGFACYFRLSWMLLGKNLPALNPILKYYQDTKIRRKAAPALAPVRILVVLHECSFCARGQRVDGRAATAPTQRGKAETLRQ